MSDKFHPISLRQLLQNMLKELAHAQSIFGIPQELFYSPTPQNPLSVEVFNRRIHNPIGVAAGPHTQMAQNIVGAWLMGARYIELKTVQTLDELNVPKPCIDMQDEGYNCEWSQELRITDSFDEYLKAWVAIHVLNHRLGRPDDVGTVFNMSVGYNLQGIMNDNVQHFLNRMIDCREELAAKIKEIEPIYPSVAEIAIPAQISNNITLSTMHGCPANEIEGIARYLIEKRGLHTYVKLNPTLLGPDRLRDILNNKLNFKTIVPDTAFEHDLKYPDAVKIIGSLRECASVRGLQFGLKLTNTLESVNNKNIFGSDVDTMYMSGRALHPIAIQLARMLQEEFRGELNLSFSAGVNAFNVAEVLACGFRTITVCSDLLRPGGYMRLQQYFEELDERFQSTGSTSIDEFIAKSTKGGTEGPKLAALSNLADYAMEVLESKAYKREHITPPDIKTQRAWDYFDCIAAPCRGACATHQDIPAYLFYASQGQFDRAYEVILSTNPFPSITGMVCDHLCQTKCTRVNYDNPLLVREVKRFVAEQAEAKLARQADNGIRVAVIGAGPSGLSCSYYLALAGFSVDVFEAKSRAGGMVQFAIPGFRLTDDAIARDLKRIFDLGVNVHYNSKIDSHMFQALKKDYRYVFIGVGAQLSLPLNIEGINTRGVIDPLAFLFDVKRGKETGIGKRVIIVGGGNTAMDAARTAFRLVGSDGRVTIVYRRTINEMPADQGEIRAVLNEGVEIVELAAPVRVIRANGSVRALLCSRMELKGVDAKGRPQPVTVAGSEFEIPCDTIIPAIGQSLGIDFATPELLKADPKTYKTRLGNVFIGGDALRGASTAINAIADGRKAAEQIMKQEGIPVIGSLEKPGLPITKRELTIKRAKRVFAPELQELPLNERRNFNLVTATLDRQTIIGESSRCLYCDELCNTCVTVCPNFANYSYEFEPIRYNLYKVVATDNGSTETLFDKVFEIRQRHQILHLANYCNECGNCNTFCPTSGAPYREKPRVHLTIKSFKADEEGYYLSRLKDRDVLIYKDKGGIKTLTWKGDEFTYETDFIMGRFSTLDFRPIDIKCKTNCVREAHFEQAAIMSVVLSGVEGLTFE